MYTPLGSDMRLDAPAGSAQQDYPVLGSTWEISPETRWNCHTILSVHRMRVVTDKQKIVAIFYHFSPLN
jgi:hypothetical protein